MDWIALNNEEQLIEINTISNEKFVLIFKHSTRCPTSSMALNRLERNWDDNLNAKISPYYLDLVSFRSISNQLAKNYQIVHESPQALLIKAGKCIFDTSHMAISVDSIKAQMH
jgi:bacillithiol system protein YtxJ